MLSRERNGRVMKPHRSKSRFGLLVVSLAVLLISTFAASSGAIEIGAPTSSASPRVIHVDNVMGACAIAGMSAEQAQRTALWQARSNAISQASGVRVSSYQVVRDGQMVIDFVRSFSQGVIVHEVQRWSPPNYYQPDPAKPPVVEYQVTLSADVRLFERKGPVLGMTAKLDREPAVYRSREKAFVEVKARKDSKVAIFNLMADDRVIRLFPCQADLDDKVAAGCSVRFPDKDSPVELALDTLPGHSEDVEAVLVIAIDPKEGDQLERLPGIDAPVPAADFFARFAEIADRVEEAVLPYRVVKKDEGLGR